MIGKAIAKNIQCSPYKLRPLVDVIRGKSVVYALQWLGSIYRNKKAIPVRKVIDSALSNLLFKNNLDPRDKSVAACGDFYFLDIRVDQGAIRKYFKPGAQGRAKMMRTRYSHISVIVGKKDKKMNNMDLEKGVTSGSEG